MLVDFERETNIRRGLSDAVRILAAIEGLLPEFNDRIAAGLPIALPWTEFLPEDERLTFLREFNAMAKACLDADVFEPLAQLHREWRETAAVHADPRLFAALTREPADREWREGEEAIVPRPS